MVLIYPCSCLRLVIFLNGKFYLTAKEFQVFENLYNKANIQLLKSRAFSDVHFKITVSPILFFFFSSLLEIHQYISCKRVQDQLVLSHENF